MLPRPFGERAGVRGFWASDRLPVVRCSIDSAVFRWPGCAPGGAPSFLCVAKEKKAKERRPHWPCPCASLRATCDARASRHGQRGFQSRGRAQRWPASKPLWLRLRRGACGVARAPQDARASCSDSRGLSERRERGERSEFHRAPRKRRDAGLPRSEAQGSQTWGRLFFAYFLLAKQKKVGAPPGAHPGRQRIQRQLPLTPALSPKGRGSKTAPAIGLAARAASRRSRRRNRAGRRWRCPPRRCRPRRWPPGGCWPA